jgi:hypothetical protein
MRGRTVCLLRGVRYNDEMSNSSATTGDELASALHTLGVDFILGEASAEETYHQRPAVLITALAESKDARLRLALIPLFLDHPEFTAYVQKAAQSLASEARLTLQCYYTAAVLQQQKYSARLKMLIGEKQLLPDLFSQDLGLATTGDPDQRLQLLARRHRALTGAEVNWLGTYQHAVQVWLRGLEVQGVK